MEGVVKSCVGVDVRLPTDDDALLFFSRFRSRYGGFCTLFFFLEHLKVHVQHRAITIHHICILTHTRQLSKCFWKRAWFINTAI